MADVAELIFDRAAFEGAGDKIVRLYLTAGADAVRATTRWLEKQLEAATQHAVPGRLWRAWASDAYPRSGPARDPVGQVFLNGKDRTRGAMQFWSQPGQVRGRSGQYLAVPLPAAGSRSRDRNLTPGQWERATGIRLQFLYRQGKPSLLVALGGTTNGRTGAFRPLSSRRQRAGRGGANPQNSGVVPIFVLLPVVPFRNAFAIDPLIGAAERALASEFIESVGKITG